MKLISQIVEIGHSKSYRAYCITCNQFLMRRFTADYNEADSIRENHKAQFNGHVTKIVVRVSSFEE
jgi:hypothetical protein